MQEVSTYEERKCQGTAPIGVFLVLYLGLGFLFEYGLKIPMGFYSIPIVVVFLIALFVACCQNRALPLEEKADPHGQRRGR